MALLIVLSNAVAASWVLENEAMAFRSSVRGRRPSPGDRFAIYVSRGAHRNPSRDEAQIVAIGTIQSEAIERPVTVAGQRYELICALSIDTQLPLRKGVPFRPLVNSLQFIRKKNGWASYVRRTIVAIPEADYDLISAAVRKAATSSMVAPRE
jgi:hypothetical protein